MAAPNSILYNPGSLVLGKFLDESALASMTLFLYDMVLTLDDEMEFIWRNKVDIRTPMLMKCSFVLLRYTALIMHISHTGLVQQMYDHFPSSIYLCRLLYVFDVTITNVMLSCIELFLMFRVWSLYGHSRVVGMTLILVALFQGAVLTVMLCYTLSRVEYSGICVISVKPDRNLYLNIIVLAAQCVIWIFTALKYRSALRAGWARTPIMKLLIRDGTWTFFGVTAPIAVDTLLLSIVNSGYIVIADNWIISVSAIAGCRMIINMQKLGCRASSSNTDTPSVQFTTDILMPDDTPMGISTLVLGANGTPPRE